MSGVLLLLCLGCWCSVSLQRAETFVLSAVLLLYVFGVLVLLVAWLPCGSFCFSFFFFLVLVVLPVVSFFLFWFFFCIYFVSL